MRGIRDTRTLLWSGLAFLLIAAGPLAPSAGAVVERLDGFKYVTKSFELPPGKSKTFKAPCPKRNHVLGGGHYNTGQFGDVIGAHSYPYDGGDRGRKPDDGWAAKLRGFTVSYDVSMYAICAKILPEYDQDTHTVSPLSTSAEYAVACDTSLDVISGGTRGPVAVREITGYPAGSPGGANVWYGAVANHRSKTEDFTVLNVCTGLDTARTIGSENGAPQTQEHVAALCPPATPRVIGGAPRVFQPSYNTAIAASRPTPNRDGWEVWIDNYNNSDEVLIQTHVICSAAL
jgi:hypothetical protein